MHIWIWKINYKVNISKIRNLLKKIKITVRSVKWPIKYLPKKMTDSKNSKLQIRNYNVEDYEIVRQIFGNGIKESYWPAWRRSWNGDAPSTLIFHLSLVLSCLLVSTYLSAWIGIIAFVVYQAIHFSFLYQFYYGYAQYVNFLLLLAVGWKS